MKKILIILLISLLNTNVFGAFYSTEKGEFSGWISKVNFDAELVRFKVVFNNLKYLNKGDGLTFWSGVKSRFSCHGYVIGKSDKYLLVKVKDFAICFRHVHLAAGSYTLLFSQDLLNNIRMGKQLTKILLKKHLALEGMLNRYKRDLDSHIDKVAAVNKRYQVLREKLEKEWRDEISALEEDRLNLLSRYEETKTRLNEVNFKLEKYHVANDNFTLDKWSLDPKEYVRK